MFVAFEGIDGSGKSTTIAQVGARLQAQGMRVVCLREPTEKTDASREIRRILLTTPAIDDATNRHLLDLFLIDRLWDIEHQIAPALRSGATVLIDRYYLSTAAYQAKDATTAQAIIERYLEDARIVQPDIVVYLALPIEQALERLQERRALDAFENRVRLTQVAHLYETALKNFANARGSAEVITIAHSLTTKDHDIIAKTIMKRSTDTP